MFLSIALYVLQLAGLVCSRPRAHQYISSVQTDVESALVELLLALSHLLRKRVDVRVSHVMPDEDTEQEPSGKLHAHIYRNCF